MKKLMLGTCLVLAMSTTACFNTQAKEQSAATGVLYTLDNPNLFMENNRITSANNIAPTLNIINQLKEQIEESSEVIEENIQEIKRQELLQKQEEISSIANKKEWFLAYKNLINEYSEWVDPPESIYDVYSKEDIYLMQRCIETETFEQDFLPKVNVSNVILNRLESGEFASEVNKVVVKGQFAFGRRDISEDTVLALEYAYMIGDTTNGATFFHSNKKTARFSGANYIFTDDAGHHFYG